MPARTLRGLMKAAGLIPAAGMSFRNHVPGAASGVRMTDYIRGAWFDWASTNYIAGGQYNSGDIINWTFSLNAGTAYPHIRVPITSIHVDAADQFGGAVGPSGEVVSGAWAAGVTGHSIGVRVQGDYVKSPGIDIDKNWYKHYAQGEPYPPGDYNPAEWEISTYEVPPNLNFWDPVYYTLWGLGDGNFNWDIPPSEGHVFNVAVKRQKAPSSFSYEWHTNHTFTALYSTDPFLYFWSEYPNNYYGTFWLRYREGTGPWQTIANGSGEVNWWDERWAK